MKKSYLLIGVDEKPKGIGRWLVLSLQHVFAMFGATVLVPLLTGLDVGVALVASGVGTLIYILCTKGKVPIYLGSSFAYIAAISAAGAVGGFSSAYIGLMVVGIIYVIVALTIRYIGSGWLKKLLPPVVVGPMIIIIGLGLAPVAIEQSGLLQSGVKTLVDSGMYAGVAGVAWKVPLIAVLTFATVVVVASLAKGFLKIIPFLFAIVVGYILSVILGVVNLGEVFAGYKFLQFPNFTFIGTYALDFSAVLMFAPIAFVTIAEHIGDHSVIGEICEKDFLTDPGLDKTLLGDGIATFTSALMGGPANTSYGENVGVLAMTRVGSVWVTGLAAIIAVCLGFFGYIQAFVNSIPWAVIGGMTIVLYGLIAGNGVQVMVKNRVSMRDMRNVIIVATMLVIGLGGATIAFTVAEDGSMISGLTGMSFAAVVGIFLNLILPKTKVNEEVVEEVVND